MVATIFWNVDTQEDFMTSTGALYVPGAEEIKETLRKITDQARARGAYVVNTADWHDADSAELSAAPDFVSTFPPHCLRGTPGAEFVRETRPTNPYAIDWKATSFDPEAVRQTRELVLYKDKFDIFSGNPHAEAVLDTLRPKEALVYGIAGNVCVDYAVMGLLDRGVRVTVIRDAIQNLPNIPSAEERWARRGASIVYASSLDEVLRRQP